MPWSAFVSPLVADPGKVQFTQSIDEQQLTTTVKDLPGPLRSSIQGKIPYSHHPAGIFIPIYPDRRSNKLPYADCLLKYEPPPQS